MVVAAEIIIKTIVRIIVKIAVEKLRRPRVRNPFRIVQFNSLATYSATTVHQCLTVCGRHSIKHCLIFVLRQLFCRWQIESSETAKIIHI